MAVIGERNGEAAKYRAARFEPTEARSRRSTMLVSAQCISLLQGSRRGAGARRRASAENVPRRRTRGESNRDQKSLTPLTGAAVESAMASAPHQCSCSICARMKAHQNMSHRIKRLARRSATEIKGRERSGERSVWRWQTLRVACCLVITCLRALRPASARQRAGGVKCMRAGVCGSRWRPPVMRNVCNVCVICRENQCDESGKYQY
jgi:hypothetical protein